MELTPYFVPVRQRHATETWVLMRISNLFALQSLVARLIAENSISVTKLHNQFRVEIYYVDDAGKLGVDRNAVMTGDGHFPCFLFAS